MFQGFARISALFLSVLAAAAAQAETVALDSLRHVHGLAVDAAAPGRLLLATHTGIFAATPDGVAKRVSKLDADFMGFAADPATPGRFYASGHPKDGGNLGVMLSEDGGVTWTRLSAGDGGPVDFHAMSASAAAPGTVYGYGKAAGVQVSRDGGRSWRRTGDGPAEIFDLTASPRRADLLHAGTRHGVFTSRDAGRTWQADKRVRRPATMIHADRHGPGGGRVHAFVYGAGLLLSDGDDSVWRLISTGFGGRYLLHLAADPATSNWLYAAAGTGAVLISRDAGLSWTGFEGSHRDTASVIAHGRRLYEENCQVCHGERGIGERPEDMYAKDEFGFVAPPLDDSAHGWHHSDIGLVASILDGSPRNQRMVAWKESLSKSDAESIVAYIKSLWSVRSHACQGARHMRCVR